MQLKCISDLMAFLGEDVNEGEIVFIASNLFGGTGTFRKGMIGSWKGVFDDEVDSIFYQNAAQHLIDWGYD